MQHVLLEKSYLHIGSARDCTRWSHYMIYRIFEMIPGILLWVTFFLVVSGSIVVPFLVSIFIIAFDFYWFLKTVYLSWHLRASFRIMREYTKVDWLKKLDHLFPQSSNLGITDWRNQVWHLIILPFYKEGYEILRNTCEAVARAGYPQDRFIVVLSGEERAGEEAYLVGEKIAQEFSGKFGRFLLTFHRDTPGELAGKGANEAWAAREAQKKLIDPKHIPYEHVILSVFDADTVVPPYYFSRLTYVYLTVKNPLRASFQPIPLFINNIWEAPWFARVIAFSSTFWHMMNQVRPEQMTSFSSQSFPFRALADIGFWQTNVVSEDSRIFWQCFLAFDGDWRVEPLGIPVSMDANIAETFWRTLRNVYLQQRRWAYGAENIPYVLYGFLHNKKIAARIKYYWMFHKLEAFWSWPTNSLMIFFMGWLPLFLGGGVFGTSVLAHNAPRLTQLILTFAMLGIITSIYLSLILLPPRPYEYGRHKYVAMIVQWFIIPLILIFFGSFPAIEAETRLMFGRYLGFWPTPKIRTGIQKKVFVE